jgi:hypothetical protein
MVDAGSAFTVTISFATHMPPIL